MNLGNGNLRGGKAAEETIVQSSDLDFAAGGTLVKWVVRRTDHAEQVDHLLQLYDHADAEGVVHRTAVD